MIEKTKDTQGVQLYITTREIVAAQMSVDLATSCLDDVFVQPNCLAQLMMAVFDKNSIKKTRLLESIKARCDHKGINAGELVIILLVDFLKVAENNFQFNEANKVQKQEVVSFMETAAKTETLNKLSLRSVSVRNVGIRNEEDEKQDTSSIWGEQENAQKLSSLAIKTSIEDRIDRMVKKGEAKRSKTPSQIAATKHSAFIDNKADKLDRMNYIVQQKSKAQENLVKAASLLKKTNKDFNELLAFASNLHNEFSEIYKNLVAAQASNPGGKIKLFHFPVKKKVVQSYERILELKAKSIQNELAPILEYFLDDKLAMKGLIITKEKETKGSQFEAKLLQNQPELSKENIKTN